MFPDPALVDLFTHIRRQAWTSVPAFVLACIVFTVLGIAGPPVASTVGEEVELARLSEIFRISPINFLPLLLLVFLSIRKAPPSLALLAAALFAGIQAVILQRGVITGFVEEIGGSQNPIVGAVQAIWKAMVNGFTINSGISDIDRLLSRGGMDSMLLTIWLLSGRSHSARCWSSWGSSTGSSSRLSNRRRPLAASIWRCSRHVSASTSSPGDQYIALVLPSRMFRVEFEQRGLAPQNLSRLAADSGTVMSPLVPWNSCGAFMGAVLGVSTLSYLPFALFNIFSPVPSVIYGFTGFKIINTPSAQQAGGPL